MDPRKVTGDRGEDRAARFLEGHGFRILARNFRAGRAGELDLIAEKSGTIFAVEVKTRTRAGADPARMVTPKKIAKMAAALEVWLAETGQTGAPVELAAIAIEPGREPDFLRFEG